MISANIKRVQIALLLILIALPTVAQQPFEALFSDRVTLDGTPLNGAYDPKMSTEIIEGMGTCHFIDNDVIPSNKITALCEDKDGNIFIGTKDAGVIRFSAISSRRDVFNRFPVADTKKNDQIAIHEIAYNNSEKRLYAATTGGLFCIADEENFNTASCWPIEAFGDRTITAMALSSSGNVWAGTSEGLFNAKGERYTEADGLPCDRITTLLFDRHDNLWVGTETGLVVRRGDGFRSVDLAGREKLWVTDLALTKKIELMIALEKYELIVKAFFAGLIFNKNITPKERSELDARMQSMLDVARPGSDTILIATADGLYQSNTNSRQASELKEGWMYCTDFKESGLMFSFNNCAEILNLSPTTRDLARFDINRRFRRRMIGRMLSEVRKDSPPALLDEATIDELYGIPEERIMPELEARLQSLRATSMLIDRNNLFWLGFDGAGLFAADANMNTGDFFVKPLGSYVGADGMTVAEDTKYRYYLESEHLNIAVESDDMQQGRSKYLAAVWDKFGFFPLKTWMNRCSGLRDDDWNRIAGYVGRALPPKAIFEFMAVLGSDPYIFVPSIQNGDIPDLEKTPGEGGLVAADEELIKAHEVYQLPTITLDPNNVIETYPANHPETRINEAPRQQPVEATFDDLPQN